MKQEALTLALEALELANINHWWGSSKIEAAITAVKEALAQPVQEPTCPECKAAVLYECVACSSNNYPPAAQSEERNFCPRCGKRTADLITIHTCTPSTGV
jgi:hypothetical protein